MKTKKKTLSSVKKKAWGVFSPFIRKRDCLLSTGSPEYGECCTCGEPLPFKELQAGHFRPKKSGNYFSEKGVHAQCYQCNMYGKNGGEKGMPLEYYDYLVELYGKKTANKLKKENQLIKKYTILDLEELIEYYKTKLEEME
ncbi:hypothetical protein LCGC14_1487500 [marine sediment metagenome]|uniref:Uncharacterized protein n=1 Tax=marine sediment metagenome TaxID=412755 RepID=A0A0F9J7S2_9ZZZZ